MAARRWTASRRVISKNPDEQHSKHRRLHFTPCFCAAALNNSLVCYGLTAFASEDQKKKYLTPLASGKALGAYSLTEPQSGSDAGNMRTRAVLQDGVYTINGRKSWVTSGPVADYIILFASTDPVKKHRGTACFVADVKLPGVTRGKTEPKLGIRASATCEFTYDDYRLPCSHRIGQEGEGFKIAMTILDAGRIGIAAQALGIAEAAFEASVKYAREREAFGSKIGNFQAIQWMIADMATEIEAARLMVYRAAWMREKGQNYTREASMAKLFSTQVSERACYKAIQIHGGYGYVRDYAVERMYRDQRLCAIGEGTNEIQRLVIARQILGQSASH